MKSGLEGRNNVGRKVLTALRQADVSMKSGLEGRNNRVKRRAAQYGHAVSMKSGLEGRNNLLLPEMGQGSLPGLNEVRPRRPEQLNKIVYTVLALD